MEKERIRLCASQFRNIAERVQCTIVFVSAGGVVVAVVCAW